MADAAKDEKLRLGGMALANGVLVHGPTSWACAVRTDDGELKVVAERKRLDRLARQRAAPARPGAARSRPSPSCRASSAALPEAKLPFEGRGVARLDGRHRGRDPGRPPLAGSATPRRSSSPACSRSRPAVLSLRSGSLAAYHGAEHIAIGTYEQDAPTREGARALRLASRRPAARSRPPPRNLLASRAPRERPAGRAARGLARRRRGLDRDLRLDAAPPRAAGSRGRSPCPGHELQHRLSTAEPSAGAARGRRGGARGLPRARRQRLTASALARGRRCR